ncbi:Aryl-phospho-beta-D-glucosidase BglC, GH1 family [Lachnospiraceae bacterium KH1T2]|nr:Aryl-phospho-beta-D-glucosidase BglC, GH1 family [Lachnospiraceae bacterium KH1T2]
MKKIIKSALCVVLCLIMTAAQSGYVPASESENSQSENFLKSSLISVSAGKTLDNKSYLINRDNLISGYYKYNGEYASDSKAVCTPDYLSVRQKTYYFCSNDPRVRVSIQEYDSNNKKINIISNVSRGYAYVPKSNTASVRLTFRSKLSERSIETLYSSGLEAYFADTYEEAEQSVADFNEVDLSDFSNWRTGEYDYSSYSYGVYDASVCTKSLLDVSVLKNRTLKVEIDSTDIKVKVMQFDSSMNGIKNAAYGYEDKVTLDNAAAYIGITLIKTGNTYDIYRSKFESDPSFFALEAYEKYIYNTKMKDISASTFVSSMNTGWNLGNSLDSHVGSWTGEEHASRETAFGNVKVREDVFNYVKSTGFDAVRIPVTWVDYTYRDADGHLHIYDSWFDRVDDVIGYALKNGLYVMINSHHDQQFIYAGTTSEKFAQVKSDAKDLWTEIAEHYKDYDEHLIFEAFNEVDNVAASWSYSNAAASQLNELNQIFVDAVRSTGGNNSKRLLSVQTLIAGYNTSFQNGFVLPKDTAKDKIMVQVHNYSSQFTQDIEPLFTSLETWSKKMGAPVIIGEWGTKSSYSPAEYRLIQAKNYVARAAAHGIKVFYWDDGNAKNYGLVNRTDLSASDTDMLKAIINPVAYINTKVTTYNSMDSFVYKTLNQTTGELKEDKSWGTIVTDINGKGIDVPDGQKYIQLTLDLSGNAVDYRIHYIHFYDANMKLVDKTNNHTGYKAKTLEIPENAKYVRIGINNSYAAAKEAKYKQLFDSGDMSMTVGWLSDNSVVPEGINNTIQEETRLTAGNYDYADFSNWQEGYYRYNDGTYDASYSGRICIKDYLETDFTKYKAVISDARIRLLVRELDKNMKFLKSNNLKDGSVLNVNGATKYLAVSIVCLKGTNENVFNNSLSYEDYRKLFEDGMVVKLTPQ